MALVFMSSLFVCIIVGYGYLDELNEHVQDLCLDFLEINKCNSLHICIVNNDIEMIEGLYKYNNNLSQNISNPFLYRITQNANDCRDVTCNYVNIDAAVLSEKNRGSFVYPSTNSADVMIYYYTNNCMDIAATDSMMQVQIIVIATIGTTNAALKVYKQIDIGCNFLSMEGIQYPTDVCLASARGVVFSHKYKCIHNNEYNCEDTNISPNITEVINKFNMVDSACINNQSNNDKCINRGTLLIETMDEYGNNSMIGIHKTYIESSKNGLSFNICTNILCLSRLLLAKTYVFIDYKFLKWYSDSNVSIFGINNNNIEIKNAFIYMISLSSQYYIADSSLVKVFTQPTQLKYGTQNYDTKNGIVLVHIILLGNTLVHIISSLRILYLYISILNIFIGRMRLSMHI